MNEKSNKIHGSSKNYEVMISTAALLVAIVAAYYSYSVGVKQINDSQLNQLKSCISDIYKIQLDISQLNYDFRFTSLQLGIPPLKPVGPDYREQFKQFHALNSLEKVKSKQCVNLTKSIPWELIEIEDINAISKSLNDTMLFVELNNILDKTLNSDIKINREQLFKIKIDKASAMILSGNLKSGRSEFVSILNQHNEEKLEQKIKVAEGYLTWAESESRLEQKFRINDSPNKRKILYILNNYLNPRIKNIEKSFRNISTFNKDVDTQDTNFVGYLELSNSYQNINTRFTALSDYYIKNKRFSPLPIPSLK
ncbi:hypothetical protein [Vibrio parahaemolyticus]|uniref:hypothetical protein n=3 Tax=Vibrio parahaemolyticus TaxID=670 RepID=UPI001121A590|nr:hypothetical protein [Vibrio parahaemolyticus]TOL00032.1 hypothetical protein CGI09_23720 [Vibrio parahaemolyticus]TOP87181.1 hypothetical protein CGH08_10145 [Vibrio parahaemolyticus]HAV1369143.1 hypothetical protein [Vibrio parahaemolyticus]HAV1426702.1 hypothetical protein [Vibrio parahaemolyticus]HAV1998395.1 hypothetical protein [Vibrio parahaemolyticus]